MYWTLALTEHVDVSPFAFLALTCVVTSAHNTQYFLLLTFCHHFCVLHLGVSITFSVLSFTSHSSFSLPCIALHCLWYVSSQLCIKVCSCYNLQHFVVIVVWFPIASLFVLYTSPLCQALCYQVFFTLPSVFMYVAISVLSCTARHHLCAWSKTQEIIETSKSVFALSCVKLSSEISNLASLSSQ